MVTLMPETATTATPPTKNRRLSIEKWETKYKPIANLISDNPAWANENGEGILFETYGAEEKFVCAMDYHYVWTFVDGDHGTYIVNGRAFVNRIGYFITQFPWSDDENFCMKVSS